MLTIHKLKIDVGVKFYPKHNYFVPFECFAGSETCFFSFLFSSFSLCSFLCCSKPAAFFSFLDKTASTLTGSRSVTHSKALSFCLHLKGRILDSYTTPISCSYFLPAPVFLLLCILAGIQYTHCRFHVGLVGLIKLYPPKPMLNLSYQCN
jgi:hypothetical protein